MTIGFKRSLRWYAVMFLMWSALGLFFFTQGMLQKWASHDPFPWWHHLLSWMVGVWIWFLITPGVLWLSNRFPLERKPRWRAILLHAAVAVAISLSELAFEAVVLRGLRLFPALMTSVVATFLFLMVIGFHQGITTYWMILGVHYAIRWYRRYEEGKREKLGLELRSAELEKQLVEAHLSTLKMQLQPHFLFNTLNAIMVLVRQGKGREAEEMLSRLSDLLRCVLEDVEAQEVPLSRELEYLQLYLAIEQVRFQDRLRVEIAVDPEMLDAAVPYMSLQPIVENAIRHGIGRSSSAGRIVITACGLNGQLEIRIRDDGPGLGAGAGTTNRGIGISNTRTRLDRLYGAAARLTVENGEDGGVVATVVLPHHFVPSSSAPEVLHAAHSPAGG